MDLYKYHAKSAVLQGHNEADYIVPSRIKKLILRNTLDDRHIEVISKNPELALYYAHMRAKPWPKGEDAIAKDARLAFVYAQSVLNNRFPKGEDVIAKDAQYAWYYVLHFIRKPWPKGEDAIAKNAFAAYGYARDIIKGPFPKGEKEIAKDPHYAAWYAMKILKKRFLQGEETIKKYGSPSNIDDYEQFFKVEL